jgi:hypothetical protein
VLISASTLKPNCPESCYSSALSIVRDERQLTELDALAFLQGGIVFSRKRNWC